MTTEFAPGKDKQLESEHHLPEGYIVLPEIKVDPEKVKKFARMLASILPPEQGAVVRKVFNLQ